jgi:hypothetical protein
MKARRKCEYFRILEIRDLGLMDVRGIDGNFYQAWTDEVVVKRRRGLQYPLEMVRTEIDRRILEGDEPARLRLELVKKKARLGNR